MADSPSSLFSIPSKDDFPKNQLPSFYSSVDDEEAMQKPNRRIISNDPIPPSHFQKIVAELVGTYIFVFVGACAALVDRERHITVVGIAMAAGFSLMVLIYTLGHISGSHFNPAVSISLASSGRLPLTHVMCAYVCFATTIGFNISLSHVYVLPQLLGSTLACLTLRVLFHDQKDISPAVTQFSGSTTELEAIIWEFILTFILMFTINGVATDDRASKGVAGAAIGLVQLFNVIIAGPITGASMNPARSIGPAVVTGIYKNLWVYVVAPILGALAASLVYSFLRSPKPAKEEDTESTTKNIYNDLYLRPDV